MDATPAGKFATHIPKTFGEQPRRILYVGKATRGDFDEPDAAETAFNHATSPFWTFARQVSRLADPSAADTLRNLAWSNIFKQGVTTGNPAGMIAADQGPDAVAELRREVEDLKPHLIVLVNAGYYEEIPKAAFAIADGETTSDTDGKLREIPVEGERYSIWVRRAYRHFPPIVWLNHPQGKTRAYTDAALREVATMTGWA